MDDHAEDFTDDKPWSDVIAASLAVQVVTFSGLLLVAFSAICRNKGHVVAHLQSFLVPAFAAGALGATTVFLLIPEALLLLKSGTAPAEEDHSAEEEVLESSSNTSTVVEDHDGHDHFLFLRRFLEEEEYHEEKEDATFMWMFGVAVLAGFLLPVLISTFFPTVDPEECVVCAATAQEQAKITNDSEMDEDERQPTDSENEDNNSGPKSGTVDLNCEEGVCGHSASQHLTPENASSNKVASSEKRTGTHGVRNWSLVASISMGDALHNFTDGIFFGQCVSTLWKIGRIHYDGDDDLSRASARNFGFGSSDESLWLAAVAGTSDQRIDRLFDSDRSTARIESRYLAKATGIFLSMSAGVYINIFACECMPRVQAQLKSPSRTLQFLLCFATGAVPIGLVLLNHGHCEEGHNH